MLVECTLGLLRAESKLSKLIARTAQLREKFDASNLKHIRILPVIATAMTTEQVKADIAQAEQLGILVFAREDIDGLLDTGQWDTRMQTVGSNAPWQTSRRRP